MGVFSQLMVVKKVRREAAVTPPPARKRASARARLFLALNILNLESGGCNSLNKRMHTNAFESKTLVGNWWEERC